MLADRQTHKDTRRRAHYNTSPPLLQGRRSNNNIFNTWVD